MASRERGRIVVLQPRRLAARLLAKRVAEERGVKLGGEVGFQYRLENVSSRETRILYVTEGILLRQMQESATLPGISVLVFDEFHERHLEGDLALARARQIQQTARPDLKIIVMSATLETALLTRISQAGGGPRIAGEDVSGHARISAQAERRPGLGTRRGGVRARCSIRASVPRATS